MDISRIPADRLGLFLDGHQVPILIQGGRDDRLDPVDSIVFFGEPSPDPRARLNNYVLRLCRDPRRFGRLDTRPDPDAEDTAWRKISLESNRVFVPLASVSPAVIRAGKHRSNWYGWPTIAPDPEGGGNPEASIARIGIEIRPEPRLEATGSLTLDVLGPVVAGVEQTLGVSVNGRDLAPISWSTPLEKRLEWRLPSGLLGFENLIVVRNLSETPYFAEPGNELATRKPNGLLIDRVALVCGTMLAGPGDPAEQIVYHLPNTGTSDRPKIQFRNQTRQGFLLYDVSRRAVIPSRVVQPGSEKETVVCCVGPTGYYRPSGIFPMQTTEDHLSGEGADYLVVTTTRFRPFIEPLLAHRRKRGLVPYAVELRTLHDTFTHGQSRSEAITRFVRAASRNWKLKPRFLLIVGDSDFDADWISLKETIPTAMVPTDYNGATATDSPFGDVDGDGLPDIAVGRLAVRTSDDLLELVERIISYESGPEPGPWRRHLRFVAGPARFDPAVDALLERTFRGILSQKIPPGYQVSLTYGNPGSVFYWPAPDFADHVVKSINEGSLFLTYVGHGSSRALDYLQAGQNWFPILEADHVPSIDAGHRPPVTALIACWTGEFDRPDPDCLAELLLREPKGPPAVIAASRISHPFPDALLGQALAELMLRERAPIGEVLLRAKLEMLKNAGGPLGLLARPFISKVIDPKLLVRDHVFIYNLLGDPAMELPLPARTLTLSGPDQVAAGATLAFHVEVPEGCQGELLVSLEAPLGDLPPGLSPAGAQATSGQIIETHRQANDRVIASLPRISTDHGVDLNITVPPTTPAGKATLVAYLAGSSDALGTMSIQITRP